MHKGVFKKGSESNQRAHPRRLWAPPSCLSPPWVQILAPQLCYLGALPAWGWWGGAANRLRDFLIILSPVYLNEPNGCKTNQPTPGCPAECTCNFLFTGSVLEAPGTQSECVSFLFASSEIPDVLGQRPSLLPTGKIILWEQELECEACSKKKRTCKLGFGLKVDLASIF